MIEALLASLKTSWRWWLIIAALVAFSWVWNENTRINASLSTMKDENDSNRAVMNNVLQTVAITNIVLGANQHAKNQIALESKRAQADIKVAVAGDDCARKLVPAVATDRLRRYADSLRASSGGTVAVEPDD